MDQFQDIGDFRFFARRIDSNDRRTAIGQQADAVAVFLVQPHLIEQPVGPCQVEAGPQGPVFGPEQGAFLDDRIVAAPGQPEIGDLVDFVAVDGQRQGAAEPHVPEDFSPHLILGVEVGVNGDMGPLHRAPQVDRLVVAFLAFLQEGVVLEGDVAALKVRFPGPGLGRDQVAKADVHDHPVDVGKLAPGGVDAVEERIAHEHEPLRGRFGGVHPRLQRRHFRIIQGIHAVLGLMQHRPVHETLFRGHLIQLLDVRIAGVKAFHVVGRAIDEQRRRAGHPGQEKWIGPGPGVTHGPFVDDPEFRQLLTDQQLLARTQGRQLLVGRHVFPVIAEVLGGEGLAVGPLVSGAQVKGEFAAVLDLEPLQDIGDEFQVAGIGDQAGIAVDGHQTHVPALAHDQAHIAAVAPGGLVLAVHDHDRGHLGDPVFDRRQLAFGDAAGKRRRFL